MIGTLNTTAMDCPVPLDNARFYQALLGGTISPDEDAEWVDLHEPSGRLILSFQRAENFVAPTWPDNTVPLQAHIDIRVDSYEAAEPTLFAAGGDAWRQRFEQRPAGRPRIPWTHRTGQTRQQLDRVDSPPTQTTTQNTEHPGRNRTAPGQAKEAHSARRRTKCRRTPRSDHHSQLDQHRRRIRLGGIRRHPCPRRGLLTARSATLAQGPGRGWVTAEYAMLPQPRLPQYPRVRQGQARRSHP